MLFALQSVSAGPRDKSLASSSPEKKFTKMNRVLVVLATVLVLVSSSTEREKLITKQVLEQMLHIHPASGDDGALPQAPLYMMDLYKKYSQGQLSPTKANSNRVTSLAPIKGQIHGIQVLMFNVSSLGSGVNEINLAEVHFYKKRQRGDRGRLKHQRGADYRVEAFILTGSSLTSMAKWKITTDLKAWQVFNVTEAVRRLSKPTSATSTQLIAFLFHKIKRSTKEYEYVNMESVVKMEPSPFLIVFSNETLPETVERSPGMSTANSTWDARPSDSVTTAETRSIGQEDQWQGALSRSGSRRRPSRSIHDNELPNADIYYKQIPRTNPGILEGRSSGRKKASKIATSNNRISYQTQPTFALTWPQHHKKKKNRKGKKKQQKKIIDSWPYNKQHVNDARFYSHEDIGKSLCQRHKLTVDFAQIGWGEWIISPKTFEAYYCAGSCPFPLTKELNPTNHATLQSIVHAIGQNPEVPAPCCVPNSLSSVTLLYFDDNKNVVLKNYPAMTADSCSCQ